MDDFLTKMYEEEKEKVASADLQEFMSTLSVDELSEFLGMRKIAQEPSEGSKEETCPECKKANSGCSCPPKEKQGGSGTKCASALRLRAVMSKMAGIPGPDEAPMPSGLKGSVVVDRAAAREERGAEAQKAADQAAAEAQPKEKESGCGMKHASAMWADQLGRFMAHELAKEAGIASMMAKGIGSKAFKPTAMKGLGAASKAVAGKGLAQRAAMSAAKRSPFQSAASRMVGKARSLARPTAQRASNLLARI